MVSWGALITLESFINSFWFHFNTGVVAEMNQKINDFQRNFHERFNKVAQNIAFGLYLDHAQSFWKSQKNSEKFSLYLSGV